jgi:hypothetical protein
VYFPSDISIGWRPFRKSLLFTLFPCVSFYLISPLPQGESTLSSSLPSQSAQFPSFFRSEITWFHLSANPQINFVMLYEAKDIQRNLLARQTKIREWIFYTLKSRCWKKLILQKYYLFWRLSHSWSEHNMYLFICSFIYLFIYSFIHLHYWGFELRASCLLGRCSTTWVMPPTLFSYFFKMEYYAFCQGHLGAALRMWSSYVCLLNSWDSTECITISRLFV